MKKVFSLLTSLIMVISLLGVMPTMSVGALESGDYEHEILDDGTVEITDYYGSATELTIPSTIGGKTVTSIGDWAFSNCYSLTSITIPDSVTSIGYAAFYSCGSLTTITIPDSVTSIGDDAFWDCYSLKNMYFNGTADDWAKITFGGYYSNPMYYAENEYFNNELITEVVLSDDITTINAYAFAYCESLTSVTIGNGVTSIGEGAFYWCISLTSVTIGNGVTSIGYAAFYSCGSLTTITIPDSVTSIGDYAFYDCDSLTSITIPDSVTSIGDGAFYWCISLTSVTIGNSVTSIGDDAFAGCDSLTSINVNTNNKYYSSVDGVLFNKNKTELIQYPIGNKRNSYTIPDSVTSIGDGAFYSCKSLTSITIPDSVTSIGDYAFYWCISLTSVTIGNSVTSIGYDAFAGCDSLTIKCYENSTAHQYAVDNDIPYELLDSVSVTKPTSFKMALNSSSSVRLEWNKVSGANGYILEQYKSGKWTRVAKITSPSTVQYSVKGLASGTTYKFRVRAYKMLSGKAYYSDYSSTVTACTKPATVKFTLTAGSRKATVKWSKVTGASGYIVYYKTSANGAWTRLKKTTGTSFTKTGLTRGKTYYFTVRAYKILDGKVYYGGYTAKSVKVK